MSIISFESLAFCLSSNICCIVNGSELLVDGLMMRSSMDDSFTAYNEVSREQAQNHGIQK